MKFLLLALSILLAASFASAREVTFAWDRNPEPDVTEYRVYLHDLLTDTWGEIARTTDDPATPEVDPAIEIAVPDFPNVVSRVRATAVNAAGLESLPSEEVVVDADAPAPPGGLRRKIVSLQTSTDGQLWRTVADYYLPAEDRLFARLEFREEDALIP